MTMKSLMLLILIVILSGCASASSSLDILRETDGKYKGWICIYPAPSETGDKCVAQPMSCRWAFDHCKGMRMLANYKTGIITFYRPQPELSFEDWSKCWNEMQDIALKGYRRK